jgi:uncharacterized membrane protein
MSKKQKYWIFGALFVSIAINLFTLGAFSYGAYKLNEVKKVGWVEKRLDNGERYFLRKLEGEDRDQAKEIFKQHRPELRSAMKDLKDARRDFAEAMGTDLPQTDELVSILDRSQQAASEINNTFHSTLRDLATRLSPDARRTIGAHMRRHHYDDDDDDDDDDD